MPIFGTLLLSPTNAGGSSTTWDSTTKDTSITLSNSNLTATGSTVGNQGFVKSTNKIPNGTRRYFEVNIGAVSGSVCIGVSTGSRAANLNSQLGVQNNECGYRASDGNFNNANTGGGMGSAYSAGDIIGIAYDDTTGNIWWAKNNTWQLSGNPASLSNPIFTLMSGSGWYAAVTCGNTGVITVNFGNQAFAYAPPAGFTAGF